MVRLYLDPGVWASGWAWWNTSAKIDGVVNSAEWNLDNVLNSWNNIVKNPQGIEYPADIVEKVSKMSFDELQLAYGTAPFIYRKFKQIDDHGNEIIWFENAIRDSVYVSQDPVSKMYQIRLSSHHKYPRFHEYVINNYHMTQKSPDQIKLFQELEKMLKYYDNHIIDGTMIYNQDGTENFVV